MTTNRETLGPAESLAAYQFMLDTSSATKVGVGT